MYDVNYHRASSTEDAVTKVQAGEDAKFLAGGQTMLPTMKMRLAAPSDLVDLAKVADLSGIEVQDRRVKIGAMTTHAEVAASSELAAVCPCMAGLASQIGDPHVRHKGTIGGSVANYDPAADYPAALLALDATVHTIGAAGGGREVKADDFFVGLFETSLEDGELVTAVSYEAPTRGHYEKFRNPASRYAMAGVFVADYDGTVRVGVSGAGADGAFRWSEAESALTANFSADALEGLSADADDMLSDIHGNGAYRANLVKVMAKRAVQKAH